MAGFAKPQLAGGAEVAAVVTAVDLKSGGEASGAAGEVEKPNGLAVALHEGDSLKWFDSTDEDSGGDAGGLADDIKHEVGAIVKKNVDVARGEIHRANPGSWAAEVMSGRIAWRIGFCFHDAAAQASGREIVDDNFSDEESCELDGICRKVGASETSYREFFRGGFQRLASRWHGRPSQREFLFCGSPEETRS